MALAKEKLTQKQKRILVYLIQKNEDDTTNVTALVSRLSRELNCTQTTVWNNLDPLKRIGLVDYGSLKKRGLPVRLTGTGMLVSGALTSRTGCDKLRKR